MYADEVDDDEESGKVLIWVRVYFELGATGSRERVHSSIGERDFPETGAPGSYLLLVGKRGSRSWAAVRICRGLIARFT